MPRKLLSGILAGLAAGALWGLVFVAPRMAPGLSSVDLTAGRFFSYGAASALAILLTLRTRKLPNWRQAMAALGMSLLGFTGYYLLLVLAIQDSGTELPALIIGTIPIWMMLLGKPVGLNWKSLVPGLVLTAAGLALMVMANFNAQEVVGAAPHPDANAHYWRGIAWVVAAMVSWTLFGLMNSAWLKRHPDVNATDWANWLGVSTGAGALVMWWFAGSDVTALATLENRAWLVFICISTGVGSAWVATILWNIASQRLSASLCGQLIVSETIFALVYSYAWYQQWPGLLQISACVLFLLGILASIKAHQ